MKKAANIHAIIRVEGEDEPASPYSDKSLALVRAIISAGITETTRRRVVQEQLFRKVMLTKIEEIEGGDDEGAD